MGTARVFGRTSLLLATYLAGLGVTGAVARTLDPLPGQATHVGPITAPYVAPARAKSGTWSTLSHAFPGSFPDTALLLTDGTVIMHEGCSGTWYRLKPSNTGSYINGTWSAIAAMPAGYTPLYFASQVLPDGRVIMNGGEYNDCRPVWSTLGALYHPATNSWTNVNPPPGWTTIGDAQSVVRADGTYMLADCCTTNLALANISGTSVTWTVKTGLQTGKADENDEEGWTTLPDQTLLAVDANRDLTQTFSDTEIFSIPTNTWSAGNHTEGQLVDASSHELGPAPLLPNGFVFQVGGTAHNGVFNPFTGIWTAGPDSPNIDGQLDSADGPAAVLPSGNILVQLSPGVFHSPSHFFEVKVRDATHVAFTQVSEPASAPSLSSYESRMLVLPTGQILWSGDRGDVEIYTPQGSPRASWAPKIRKVATTLTRGSTNNVIKGKKFNGLTEGGYYGDDAQMSTNYPLVRFINTGTGHVCYARTHDHSVMGISDGSTTSTKFDIPNSCETGASQLEVVVNGIASQPVAVTIN